jgi:hypothetical protein
MKNKKKDANEDNAENEKKVRLPVGWMDRIDIFTKIFYLPCQQGCVYVSLNREEQTGNFTVSPPPLGMNMTPNYIRLFAKDIESIAEEVQKVADMLGIKFEDQE